MKDVKTYNPWNPSTYSVRYNPLQGLLAGRRLAQKDGLLPWKATFQDDPDTDQYATDPQTERILSERESKDYCLSYPKGNLVVSAVDDDATEHQFCIDIDLPATLIETQSGEGHYHLYVNTPVPIPTKKYMKLLKLLAECGIIEEGYYGASKAKGYTALRVPPSNMVPVPRWDRDLEPF